jgi:mannobiose 2-epimerase
MENKALIEELRSSLKETLQNNILEFWLTHGRDKKREGFIGKVEVDNTQDVDAPKGCVLNGRILWSFSAAYNTFPDARYLEAATEAYNYIVKYFIDKEFGGTYWLLDCNGKPLADKKQIYAIAFVIYGLSEYYKATKKQEVLDHALALYQSIEDHSFDKERNGYFEAFARDWSIMSDLRLSDKDANESKTMNTHLHIMEAYTTLAEVTGRQDIKDKVENLVNIHLDKFLDWNTGHLLLFFDDNWTSKSEMISYGHDIEAAWLIHDAALCVGKPELIQRTEDAAKIIAEVTLKEGIQPDGGLIYELDPGHHLDSDRHWWVQAESMVGFSLAWKLTGNQEYLQTVLNEWKFVQKYIICPSGEWYWSVSPEYVIKTDEGKAGMWKCPYHNSRGCIEVFKRLK